MSFNLISHFFRIQILFSSNLYPAWVSDHKTIFSSFLNILNIFCKSLMSFNLIYICFRIQILFTSSLYPAWVSDHKMGKMGKTFSLQTTILFPAAAGQTNKTLNLLQNICLFAKYFTSLVFVIFLWGRIFT